jgi:hypothetical protein
MTQPSFVPIAEADQVRPALRLEPPRRWVAHRPAELRFPVHPGGPGRGRPGPDQGYALGLARRFEGRLRLREGESPADALAGAALIASRRSALYGRAPTVFDLEAALALWGFLADDPPADLVAARRAAFSGASHDYVVQRALVDRVPEHALRMRADAVAATVAAGQWRELVGEPLARDG